MATEEVQVLAGVEPVLGEFRFSSQEAEVLRSGHRRPEPGAAADGAVAAIRTLSEVEIRLEPDCAAMTTAAVGFEHDDANRGERGCAS